MLAGLDDLLGGGRSSRERFARRCFGWFIFATRVINALDRILAMHHPAFSGLALELSIEHAAGEDGRSPIAAES
jgi:hypothetical protein